MNTSSSSWRPGDHPARYWESFTGGRVRCNLCPRHCLLRDGQCGYCGVRKNVGEELRTLNYGMSTQATQEFVETEEIFHFAPGAKVLSLGNVGCMLHCAYCHNWRTSQARHARQLELRSYTPASVVRFCLEKSIPIIAWTFSDPVVWQEFVVDTAKLARAHGILNLYKSAFYIAPGAARELAECIDVFSLSIKTMDPALHRVLTQGELAPILEAAKVIFQSGKHLEISHLMVTDTTDSEEEAIRLANWVLKYCSPETPVHFVRFHPDYRYTHVGRTPIDRLARAREAALARGLKYVYLGNVFNHPGAHTHCPRCRRLVIARYGAPARIEGMDLDGTCRFCGTRMPFAALRTRITPTHPPAPRPLERPQEVQEHQWEGEVLAIHVEVKNEGQLPRRVAVARRHAAHGQFVTGETFTVLPQETYRFVVCRSDPREIDIRILSESELRTQLLNVLDRAHYPTQELFAPGPFWGNPGADVDTLSRLSLS
jgi:pyruvate formate lyase activating enzyme